jgi:glycosyltransferase involved in cell wall biosynthesis
VTDERETVELSLVIPVYNGSRTIGALVERIQAIFATKPFEIILVNDWSEDESEMVCSNWLKNSRKTVAFVTVESEFR